MSIEVKIQELQRQLAVKTAYLGIEVKLRKDVKNIPADVLEEVTNKIKELCAQLAEGVEVAVNTEKPDLTPEEIKVLKQLADRVLNAPKQPVQPSNPQAAPNPPPAPAKPVERPLTATIMLLDNVDPTIRKKIAPQSEVRVISVKGDQSFVADTNHNRFWIPSEDLEFNLPQN